MKASVAKETADQAQGPLAAILYEVWLLCVTEQKNNILKTFIAHPFHHSIATEHSRKRGWFQMLQETRGIKELLRSIFMD